GNAAPMMQRVATLYRSSVGKKILMAISGIVLFGFIVLHMVGNGSAPEADITLVTKPDADAAFDAAACIGCGACVAACPNASAMLFTAAKVAHLSLLPQGQPERDQRVIDMVAQHDDEEFGNCTNHGACQVACPKGISVDYIARLNRDLFKATVRAVPRSTGGDEAA
ncbi:MAG: 4Fe-4S dicluster domain-containing protein, partial [Gemmatimonadetes bacterium]|nr:4Fe-4S dicluster domain-containing protein [Gemmatimonadota bacterium]